MSTQRENPLNRQIGVTTVNRKTMFAAVAAAAFAAFMFVLLFGGIYAVRQSPDRDIGGVLLTNRFTGDTWYCGPRSGDCRYLPFK
jgi:hypothetical protein